jgi:hypothetical protein
MGILTQKSTFSHEKTIADVAQPFIEHNIPYHEVNFHVYDNDVFYGDGTTMAAIAVAGSIIYFDKGDLRDHFFMNKVGGQTGRVVAVATVPHPRVQEALR